MLTGIWLIDMAYRQSRSAWKIGGCGTGWCGQSMGGRNFSCFTSRNIYTSSFCWLGNEYVLRWWDVSNSSTCRGGLELLKARLSYFHACFLVDSTPSFSWHVSNWDQIPKLGQGTTDIPSLTHIGVPIVAWRRERSWWHSETWGIGRLIDLHSQVWTNTKSRMMMMIIIIIIIIIILHYYHYIITTVFMIIPYLLSIVVLIRLIATIVFMMIWSELFHNHRNVHWKQERSETGFQQQVWWIPTSTLHSRGHQCWWWQNCWSFVNLLEIQCKYIWHVQLQNNIIFSLLAVGQVWIDGCCLWLTLHTTSLAC